MCWTQQYKKAVTFSYDDGNEQDIRLVEILNAYGLKCTFHLNTALGNQNGSWKYKDVLVKRLDLCATTALYQGHEIAVHGRYHYNLCELSDTELRDEIEGNIADIEEIFGTKPQGMSYAYGAYNLKILDYLASIGMKYARTVEASHGFALPENPLRLLPTCHHDDPFVFDLIEQFLSLNTTSPQLLYIWGHSYELDGNHNWDHFEELCKRLAHHSEIFYGTNAQILCPEELL